MACRSISTYGMYREVIVVLVEAVFDITVIDT